MACIMQYRILHQTLSLSGVNRKEVEKNTYRQVISALVYYKSCCKNDLPHVVTIIERYLERNFP